MKTALTVDQLDIKVLRAALRRCERELSHWHGWRWELFPEYRNSDGAKHCADILNNSRDVLRRTGV